jgi:hypothetical protein
LGNKEANVASRNSGLRTLSFYGFRKGVKPARNRVGFYKSVITSNTDKINYWNITLSEGGQVLGNSGMNPVP